MLFTLGGLRVEILMLGLHQSPLTTTINLVALFEEIIGFLDLQPSLMLSSLLLPIWAKDD